MLLFTGLDCSQYGNSKTLDFNSVKLFCVTIYEINCMRFSSNIGLTMLFLICQSAVAFLCKQIVIRLSVT